MFRCDQVVKNAFILLSLFFLLQKSMSGQYHFILYNYFLNSRGFNLSLKVIASQLSPQSLRLPSQQILFHCLCSHSVIFYRHFLCFLLNFKGYLPIFIACVLLIFFVFSKVTFPAGAEYFRIFSNFFIYFQIFSCIFIYFHIFSHIFTYFHHFLFLFFPNLKGYLPSWCRSTNCWRQGRGSATIRCDNGW